MFIAFQNHWSVTKVFLFVLVMPLIGLLHPSLLPAQDEEHSSKLEGFDRYMEKVLFTTGHFPSAETYRLTPTGKPAPLAVRLAQALPFQRAQVEMKDALAAHDDLHTADGAHAQVAVFPGHTARHGDVMTHTQRQQGVGRAFRPFLHVTGPLWGPSSNYPLCG